MNVCYIIYSPTTDRYYIGATHDSAENRIQKHNDKKYGVSNYYCK
ncbi:MAG: GIY-YIG nuclease family protein [Ferruginibacter sp.]